jgi:hypothetical protein
MTPHVASVSSRGELLPGWVWGFFGGSGFFWGGGGVGGSGSDRRRRGGSFVRPRPAKWQPRAVPPARWHFWDEIGPKTAPDCHLGTDSARDCHLDADTPDPSPRSGSFVRSRPRSGNFGTKSGRKPHQIATSAQIPHQIATSASKPHRIATSTGERHKTATSCPARLRVRQVRRRRRLEPGLAPNLGRTQPQARRPGSHPNDPLPQSAIAGRPRILEAWNTAIIRSRS